MAFEVNSSQDSAINELYAPWIATLDAFTFWRAAENGTYRPHNGLWLPQRRAVAFAHAYLAAWKTGIADGQAALIKMPTGTGKSAVIATLACVSPTVHRTLILTPREGLVSQMRFDLSYRFWGKAFGSLYDGEELHENAGDDAIDRLRRSVHSGILAPARTLEAAQYKQIYDEKGKSRQILVGTFNALHRILGLEPPPHRSTYGRNRPEPAASLEGLPGGVEAFRDMLRNFDLVIVDEGHYEPAYAWSQAIRALELPTIVFSATPYRNDYKYFKIDGNFVFNLAWDEAVRERLIRDVQVRSPLPRPVSTPSTAASTREANFVETFRPTLAALPPGKKVIVHAATFRSLAFLQRAFHDIAGEAAVLIHDVAKKPANKNAGFDELDDAGCEQLQALRFARVRDAVVDETAAASRIWLHQYKLLEGIDDPSVIEIWLLDPFGSARALIQQVGRATRLADLADTQGQIATVRGSASRTDKYIGAPTVHEQIVERWQNYLEYERYAADEVGMAFRAETQLLASVKRAAPAVQYIAREFRGGHLLDEAPTMAAFILPRRANVCVVENITDNVPPEKLDELVTAFCEAMLLEERFDIAVVPPPPGAEAAYADIRLIRYLLWSNSPYLFRHHIPEWRLGIAAIARAGRHIFLLDTEGIPIDKSRLKLLAPPSDDLRRLFPHTDVNAEHPTRIAETGASGLDLGERGLRSIRLRRHALERGYFDLAEASQVPTSVSGVAPHDGGSTRRRLSLGTSSVSDATYGYLPVDKWLDWTRSISHAMTDPAQQPHSYFDRFAHEVPPPARESGAPVSILLDLWGLLDELASEDAAEKGWDEAAIKGLLEYDTCCDVTQVEDDDGKLIAHVFMFGPHEIEITYVYRPGTPARGRYRIEGAELDEAVVGAEAAEDAGVETHLDERVFGRKLPSSLIRSINQQQSFRVIPGAGDCIYSLGHFYKPELSESLLELLEPSALLDTVVSEKGDTRLKDAARWGTDTLFGLIFGWASGAAAPATEQLARDLAKCDLILCDDSTKETADFYAVDDGARRVLLVHAKAAQTESPQASAGKLQDVTRQAQASLAFAGSAAAGLVMPAGWSDDWSVKLKDVADTPVITKARVLKGSMSIGEAHAALVQALSDPTYRKEVVMFTSGLLGAAAAKTAFKRRNNQDLQFLYFLASARTSFDRAGVRYRIVCNR